MNDSAERLSETQQRIDNTVSSNKEAFNITDQVCVTLCHGVTRACVTV